MLLLLQMKRLCSVYNQITKGRKFGGVNTSAVWDRSIVDFVSNFDPIYNFMFTSELVQRLETRFDNIAVLNYHDKSPDVSLFCNELYNMTHMCQAVLSQDQQNTQVINKGDNLDYTNLAYGAAKAGLINVKSHEQLNQIAKALDNRHQQVLNGTAFARACPSIDVLNSLWEKSLAYEQLLFPHSDKSLMREHFDESAQTKLCNVDVENVLKEKKWRDFIISLRG